MTAVRRDGGGEAGLLKHSPCLQQHLSASQSLIYRHPGWEAVLERSPAASPRAFKVPKSLCFVPQGWPWAVPKGDRDPYALSAP